MLPKFKSYKPEIISLKEITDLYFDYYHISFVKFTAIDKCNRFGICSPNKFFPRLEGRITEKAWEELPSLFKYCIIGDHRVKPNEFQALLVIDKYHSPDLAANMFLRFSQDLKKGQPNFSINIWELTVNRSGKTAILKM